MRVVAGKFRGKKLRSPQDKSIRPTSDRVREALFNILVSQIGPDFPSIRVLDLFAGTGALGIEALSRGAQYAMFVDNGAEARGIIRAHIEAFGLAGCSKLLRRDATMLGEAGNFEPFNLIFADPPYAKGLAEMALIEAFKGGWLAADATIVVEEQKGVEISLPADFKPVDQRGYGKTAINIFHLKKNDKN